jgi:membrane peptidoglycan carboxypeptidase
MLPNPKYYNPFKRPDKARGRQERVLFNMQQAKIITPEEYTAALAAPLTLRQEGAGRLFTAEFTPGYSRPCYQQALEQALLSVMNEHDLYRSGKTIKTTLDKSLQTEFGLDSKGIAPDKDALAPNSVLVIKQGNSIRVLVCNTDREKEILDKISSLGFLFSGYEVSTVSPDSISRDQIILPNTEAAPAQN